MTRDQAGFQELSNTSFRLVGDMSKALANFDSFATNKSLTTSNDEEPRKFTEFLNLILF